MIEKHLKVIKGEIADKFIFEKFLDQYLSELNNYRDIKIGAVNSTTYPFLDSYWLEPGRHPFLFFSKNKLAGFALIRDHQSTKSTSSQVAEFYVVPRMRGTGVGQRAIITIFSQFPGAWELQIHAQNASAISFWTKCIELKAIYPPKIKNIVSDDGNRVQYEFEV